jgi:small subunit ribosomal protein S18
MSSNSKPKRTKQRETTRKFKKKVSILVQERVEYIDYKDVNLLQRFVSDRSKIRARRVSGNDTQQQRDIAIAIKNAREMALLPYAKRVTTQRTARPERGERGDRARPDATALPVEDLVEGEELVLDEVEKEG